MTDPARLRAAYAAARDALLAERVPAGHWVGELSTSALSTATAVMALHLADAPAHRALVAGGVRWLADHQNPDGGWGDTTKSFSNISTTMLCRAALALVAADLPDTLRRVEAYLTAHAGTTPAERAEAIRRRYGTDRTFSVPILMACALAGLVPWAEVPRLPFELACLPQSWYRFARLPVVSYALPALVAIGQCVHANRRSWNPLRNVVRWLARGRSLAVLRRIQPSSGGYLEATPLTSFVVMALMGTASGRRQPAVSSVVTEGVRFLVSSVRPDGSWPIDTNLATWVTTLSVNALAAADDLDALDSRDAIYNWLLNQQYTERHPYTGADPGGWAWTDLPGGVPDCDDTPGAVLAVKHLTGQVTAEMRSGVRWMLGVWNSDWGFPTFCRGWGKLPFDRSGSDLTAHAIRAIAAIRPPSPPYEKRECMALACGVHYLSDHQGTDGSWLPLWFGNQHAPDDINPVYGTARVLAAYRDLGRADAPECQRGVTYLRSVQNADGGWGGAAGCPSSVEETAVAVEVLVDLEPDAEAVGRGLAWLVDAVETGRFREASPIGFYFAKLWYFEKLYPLIFTVAALGLAARRLSSR
ncbi:prenyltransferase/squalene oxidase repeat-containing protein [Urbifossiella limnaea]|uniref:Sporulenol synthase n=1 Tax=Urbifossiella limnaea TaxID=2528023 RepID=A0A517XMK4_9BACT|nr:prenyltransferase/squalene oxidase repeat-containing protein [Urbifossiella limnaea]QDU18749.1 Sporulenol synthase [Urbifossiella limnaea]